LKTAKTDRCHDTAMGAGQGGPGDQITASS
jgi:hypothetical protein